mmetsp:Transcript_42349/g.100494  ORF Transcript_42349/g.100494 Transcript_42349/m.100494 type:complete len:291 (+) Transcript_42349:368-1240(+)
MRAVEFNKRRDNIVDVQHIPLCVAPRSGLQWQALVYGKPRRPQPVGLRPLFGGVLLRRAVHDPAYAVHVAVPEVPQDLIGIGRQHHDLLRRERLEDVAPVLVDRPAIGAHLGRKRGDRSFPAAEGQSCRPRRPLVRHDAVLELLRHAPDLPVRELVDEGALDDDADSVGEPLPHALLLLEVCLDLPSRRGEREGKEGGREERVDAFAKGQRWQLESKRKGGRGKGEQQRMRRDRAGQSAALGPEGANQRRGELSACFPIRPRGPSAGADGIARARGHRAEEVARRPRHVC